MAGTLSDQTTQTPEIERVADPGAVAYSVFAPKTNPALQLAGALSDLRPEAGEAAERYAINQENVQNAKAAQDALKTKGNAFADAVRSGQIEPTQNPWYIQAYQKNAAQVQTQQFGAQLNAQSASWAEQNDPAAFQQKYMAALSDFGKQFTDPDAQAGFNAAAEQAKGQAFAANTERTVQAITEKRKQDVSALVTKAVMDTNAAHGGRATPSQIQAAIAPLQQQWHDTGGQRPDFNTMVADGIAAAAESTDKPNLVDVAKGLSNGSGGSIYDDAGVAENLETIRHRIDQQQRFNLSMELQAMAARREIEAQDAGVALFKMAGTSMYTGMSADQITQYAAQLSQKYSPQAVAAAVENAARASSGIVELSANNEKLYGASSAGASHIAAWHEEADTQGFSPELEQEVGIALHDNRISQATADQLMDLANKTSAANASKALPAGAGPTQRLKAIQGTIKAWSDARDQITKTVASSAQTAARGGTQLTPADQEAWQDAAIKASSDWLRTHAVNGKQDFAGAAKAAHMAVGQWIDSYIAKRPTQGSTP